MKTHETGGSETQTLSGISLPNFYLGTGISGCFFSCGAELKICFLNIHYFFGTSLITLPTVFLCLGDKAPNRALSRTGLLRCTVISSYIAHHCKHPSYKICFTGTVKAAGCQGMFFNEGKEYLNTSMTWQPFLLFISYYTLQRENILEATF